MAHLLASLVLAASAATGASATALTCKNYPGTALWPSSIAWAALNFTVGGRLEGVVPPAAPCYNKFGSLNTYNAAECSSLSAAWGTQPYHYEDPVSIMNDLYTNRTCLPTTTPGSSCTSGEYPAYVVKAQSAWDIQAAVLYAALFNIRLNIKNTGHDFMGRSAAAGSLSIWTHNFQDLELVTYKSSSYNGPAVKAGAGVQHTTLYPFLEKRGYVVVGGECQSVGWAGGYLPGGGHGPFATMYGMGSDNVLEYQIVTAQGLLLTVNENQNTDLFWALRGGGPATFGITVSVTVKVYPNMKVAGAIINFGTMSTDKYWAGIEAFHAASPNFTAQNMYAYYEMTVGYMYMKPLLAPGKTAAQLNTIIAPLRAKWDALGVNYTANVTEYASWMPAYKALFDGEPAGASQFVSSRLFNKEHIQANNTAITAAFRKLVDGGRYIIGHMVAPGVNGGANNAVNPVWKSAVLLPLTNVFMTPAQKIEDVIADQVQYDNAMKAASPNGGTYLNEANIYDPDFKTTQWGSNYARLAQLKQKWDPLGLFYIKAGVGSDQYKEVNGRLCPA